MQPELWPRVKEIFQAVTEHRPEDRPAFLDQACDDQPALRREVERLLAGDERAAGAMETPAFDLAARVLAAESTREGPEMIGRRIGDYQIKREIGQGGMGRVYLASRADGRFDKQVALKLVQRGMMSAEVLDRFRLERRILAGLEHPAIARIYDAGASDDGQPYFVMEYVEGLPIDRYCNREDLGVEGRLRLFQRVCGAVQHAHQNLIVHRDLKPANILVTADGLPKLLDFGIAKWLDPEDGREPVSTRPWQRRLTPEYASPEQIRGEALTTASDVYSLGVLLYELLTGRRPYRFQSANPEEIERVFRQREPRKPSLAVTGRQPPDNGDGPPASSSSPARGRQLAGDLDNIVLKALHQDPLRRYGSADQLAEDVRRYLEGLPVKARGAGRWYRWRKFLRRHRWGVALLAVGLGLAVAISALWSRAALTAAVAEQQRAKADAVTGFLLDLINDANPRGRAAGELTLREVLAAAVSEVDKLGAEPRVQAEMMDTLGIVCLNLDLLDTAEPLLRQSFEIRQRLHGDEHPEVAASLDHLGRLLRQRGDLTEAESLIRRGLDLRTKLLAPDDPDIAESLTNLGLSLDRRGEHAEAEPLLRRALDIHGESSDSEQVAKSLSNLAGVLFKLRDVGSAERLYRESLAILEQELDPDHPNLATVLQNLAVLLDERQERGEAELMFRRALTVHRRHLGSDHQGVAVNAMNLARLLRARGENAEAEILLREALEIFQGRLGAIHPATAAALFGLATVQYEKGDIESAEPLFRQALSVRRQTRVDDHPEIAQSLVGLGMLLTDSGRAEEAEPQLREALRIRLLRPEFPQGIALAESALGACLARRGEMDEAEALLIRSYPVLEARFGAEHQVTKRVLATWEELCQTTLSDAEGCFAALIQGE